MKVGFYIDYFNAENPGGRTSYVINIIRQLQKYEELDLYLISLNKFDHPIFHENKLIILPKIPILNLTKLKNQKLDIIHFNRIPVLPTEVTIYFLIKNVKKVASLHGEAIYVVPELYDYTSVYFKNYLRFIEPRLSKKMDAILPVSKSLGDRLLQYYKAPKNKYHAIYNGLDHDLFKHVEKSNIILKEKYGIEKDFILHVSNYSIQKNPITILKTFENLVNNEGMDLDLIIIGRKWSEKIDRFLIDIKPKLKNRIKIMGSIDHKELPIFYSAAKLLFSPSYHETFGFPNIEAMACGTPVVTSNVYSIPEITGGAAVLHEPDDIKGFVTSIKSILQNNEICENLVRKGLENAKRFNWEKSAEELFKIYNQLV